MILLKKKKDLLIRREAWICHDVRVQHIKKDLKFPGLKQVICIVKKEIRNQVIERQESWYGITSCTSSKLIPGEILKKSRQHWEVENCLHHVKDRSWYEDWQYSKCKNTGFALGIFRNISLNLIRLEFDNKKQKNKSKESMPKKALKFLCNPLRTLRKIMKI
jgi:predicted transposase YbfD/YdcC